MFPNFLVIGAQKAGTTSLYHYLGQHPHVFMSPVKEPRFFAFDGHIPRFNGPGDQARIGRTTIVDRDSYVGLFHGVTLESAVGEASTLYLYDPRAATRIRAHIPEVKLIAILRDPADRAYSAYLHLRRDGREPLPDFERALRAEDQRVSANWASLWHYRRVGQYLEQMRRYHDTFDRDQLRIYLYEDFRSDPTRVLRDIFAFLGVDDRFVPDVSLRHNVTGIPRWRWLYELLSGPSPLKAAAKSVLPASIRRALSVRLRTSLLTHPKPEAETHARLRLSFANEIHALQDLLDMDLSSWLVDRP